MDQPDPYSCRRLAQAKGNHRMTGLIRDVGRCVVALLLIAGIWATAQLRAANAAQAIVAAKEDVEKAAPEKVKTDAEKGSPEKANAKETPSPKPPTHTVKKELLKIELSVNGVFEPKSMAEIVVRPQEWKILSVLKAVEHGATVDKGDLLVQFDLEKIDQAIADHRTNQRLSELTLKQTEETLQMLEASTPLDLASAERAKRITDEDLKRYFEVDRPLSEKSAEFSLKSAKNSLEYQLEELRQLEKMYKADDLTEETEEIILKRQRDAVERAEFNLEQAEIHCDEALKVRLPREDETIKEATRRQNIAYDKTKATLPLALSQKRLELDKMKLEQTRSQQKLKKLLADRAAMSVKSPIDGVVYYGKYVHGEWSGASTAAASLRLGGKISPDDVFMTVVKPRPMCIRATVPEKDLHWFDAGLKGTAQPTAYPDVRLNCSVEQIETLPLSAGKFAARLKVKLNKQAEALMPGMACTVKLVPYLKKDALTVPEKAVFTDELDDQKHYVYLLMKDRPPRRRRVKVGQKSDDRVEILQGLSEGDQVLLERPKDEQ